MEVAKQLLVAGTKSLPGWSNKVALYRLNNPFGLFEKSYRRSWYDCLGIKDTAVDVAKQHLVAGYNEVVSHSWCPSCQAIYVEICTQPILELQNRIEATSHKYLEQLQDRLCSKCRPLLRSNHV